MITATEIYEIIHQRIQILCHYGKKTNDQRNEISILSKANECLLEFYLNNKEENESK